MSESHTIVTFRLSDFDGSIEVVEAEKKSLQRNEDDILLLFGLYSHHEYDEAHYHPYFLTTVTRRAGVSQVDRSKFTTALSVLGGTGSVSFKTYNGFVNGANSPQAKSGGPSAMRSAGFKGAAKAGLKRAGLLVLVYELYPYVKELWDDFNASTEFCYATHEGGKIYKAPIRLKV